jgi:hypothetical protein
MKILCTGNPKKPGIAQALSKKFDNITFISQSNGYDLLTVEGIEKFENALSFHTVFVNCSQIGIGVQEQLLKISNKLWKNGVVINIGSVLEFQRWEWIDPETANEKRNLRDLSINLCNEHFKTTHLIVGGFQDTGKHDPLKFNPDCIADTIAWILNNDMHIAVMSVDKLTDTKIQYWRNKQCQI